jgi:hypothetical protein
MKKITFIFILFFLESNGQFNATIPIINPPEDCPTALRICDATQEYSFQLNDDGLIDDAHGSLIVPGLIQTSPTQWESKIAWLKFTPQYSGQFGFLIYGETTEIFQFQMFTNPNCNDIETGAYSTNGTTYSSNTTGINGIGPGYLIWINLTAGNTYVLVVQTQHYLQTGTHRFTLKFQGQLVTDHPDVFNHPDCALATEEVIKTDDFVIVSPNPFTEKFTINSLHAFEKMALYDVTGKLILTQTFAKTIEIKNLSQGVYFLHLIDSEGNKVVKKLVKE